MFFRLRVAFICVGVAHVPRGARLDRQTEGGWGRFRNGPVMLIIVPLMDDFLRLVIDRKIDSLHGITNCLGDVVAADEWLCGLCRTRACRRLTASIVTDRVAHEILLCRNKQLQQRFCNMLKTRLVSAVQLGAAEMSRRAETGTYIVNSDKLSAETRDEMRRAEMI